MARPAGDLGAQLENDDPEGDGGLDAKWTPNENTALDVTINPDFSQIESDVAQIGVNERFALFFPEKRPFFLEGIELFTTPIQAVYTRTITVSPLGHCARRASSGSTAYTALLAEDRGGGSVDPARPERLLGFADQDFRSSCSWAAAAATSAARSSACWRRRGRSTTEASTGSSVRTSSGGRPSRTVTGQVLYSWTRDSEPPGARR